MKMRIAWHRDTATTYLVEMGRAECEIRGAIVFQPDEWEALAKRLRIEQWDAEQGVNIWETER